MDQIKIGKFIAERRKEKGLTQTALAEKLMISNKTISKWETGKGLPEVSLMLPLCEELGINVNELLTGERIPEKNYVEKAEENMMKLVNEAHESKRKFVLSTVVGVLTILSYTSLALIAGLVELATPLRLILIAVAFVILIFGSIVMGILDREASDFECLQCHSRFVPDMKDYITSIHIKNRKLECPHCQKKTSCKRVFTK